jgi:transmembrane protein
MLESTVSGVQTAIERLLTASWVMVAARIAVAAPFLVSGIAKLADFPSAISEVRGLTGLEPAGLMAALVVLTQLAGSALVIAGGRLTWIGTAALACFTIVATLYAHAFWLKPASDGSCTRTSSSSTSQSLAVSCSSRYWRPSPLGNGNRDFGCTSAASVFGLRHGSSRQAPALISQFQ